MHKLIRGIVILCLFTAWMNAAQAEPDDTAMDAVQLELSERYSGSLSSLGDEDYYRFQLPSAGNIAITLQHIDESLTDSTRRYWVGRLYVEEDLVNSLHDVYLRGTPMSSRILEGLPAGNYYLKIAHNYHSNTAPYFLTVDFTASDYFEQSPNHTPDQATLLQLGHEYSANLADASDVDYFVFDVPKDGNLTIQLSHNDQTLSASNKSYWWGYLYQQGNLAQSLRILKLTGAGMSVSAQEGLAAGRYFLKIKHNMFISPVQYSLSTNWEDSDFYEKSPNATPADATPIALNRQYKGNLASSSDIDYFTFEMPAAGLVNITLSHDDETLTASKKTHWEAYLYAQGDLTRGAIVKSGVQSLLKQRPDCPLSPRFHL